MKRFFSWTCIVLFICSCAIKKEIHQHREVYKSEFIKDPRSPLGREDLQHLDFYPASSKARIETVFHFTPDAEPFDMPTYSGQTRNYRKFGEAKFLWDGDSVTLAVYQNLSLIANPIYNDYLFLPFKDETNGVTTYGGGRYLNVSKSDTEDQKLQLDFNKSYNPWCAFSDGFNCPIPPVENHLSFPVYAGEKQYKGVVKHN